MKIRNATVGLLAGCSILSSAGGNVFAADLGGDCCADLEERIAELEATTARKGNRKVSLTITGWVVETLQMWDDGVESDVYVAGPGTTLASNVQFRGSAVISPGFSAGYVIQLEINPSDALHTSQDVDNGVLNPGFSNFGTGVTTFYSNWFLKSDKLGQVAVGTVQPATDNVTIIGVDGSGIGSIFAGNSVNFGSMRNFVLRRNGVRLGANTWNDVANCWQITDVAGGIGMDCTATSASGIRYDSPTIQGLKVSAYWGEDDMWDVGAQYSNSFGGFKFNAGIGYSENKDENRIVPSVVGSRDVSYFQIGAYLEHEASGLFVYGTYGTEDINSTAAAVASPSGFELDEDHAFYLKGGIRAKWFPIGHTIPYVEYQQSNDMLSAIALGQGATGSELTRWGVGVAQEIDAAHMSLWVSYKNWEGEITGPAATCATLCGKLDDFQRVELGAMIPF